MGNDKHERVRMGDSGRVAPQRWLPYQITQPDEWDAFTTSTTGSLTEEDWQREAEVWKPKLTDPHEDGLSITPSLFEESHDCD